MQTLELMLDVIQIAFFGGVIIYLMRRDKK